MLNEGLAQWVISIVSCVTVADEVELRKVKMPQYRHQYHMALAIAGSGRPVGREGG